MKSIPGKAKISVTYFRASSLLPRPHHLDPLDFQLERPGPPVARQEAQAIDILRVHRPGVFDHPAKRSCHKLVEGALRVWDLVTGKLLLTLFEGRIDCTWERFWVSGRRQDDRGDRNDLVVRVWSKTERNQ